MHGLLCISLVAGVFSASPTSPPTIETDATGVLVVTDARRKYLLHHPLVSLFVLYLFVFYGDSAAFPAILLTTLFGTHE